MVASLPATRCGSPRQIWAIAGTPPRPPGLTVEDQPGRRIARRDSSLGASQRTTGYEAGRWQPRTISDSTRPGPDGDHWFAVALRSGPEQDAAPITLLLTTILSLTTTLSLGAGPVTITLPGSAATAGPHQVQITTGTATASARWEGTGDWTQMITLDTAATSAEITLLPGATADSVLIDRVQCTCPVGLAVDGPARRLGRS